MAKNFPDNSRIIIFLGPDGAGKSTIMELVDAGLKERGCNPKTYYFAPGFLKRYRPSPVISVTTEPHALAAYGPALVFLKISLMLVEFNLGVRKVRRENEVVMFDRFVHDVLIDPKRYRMGHMRWWMSAMLALAPKPDIAVIITASVDVIQARKQEVPPEETARQVIAYQHAARKFPHSLLIENEGPPESLAERIVNEIMAE